MVSAREYLGRDSRGAASLAQTVLEQAGCPDADFDARELVRFATGREQLSGRELSAAECERLVDLVTRRAGREPLQYILGSWDFLDFTLKVGPGVLCPRADTEVVCEAAADTLRGKTAPKVLDLCSGSGCLALGIKRLVPGAVVTAVEKSFEAFEYCAYNCKHSLQNGTVDARMGDLFSYQEQLAPGGLDLLVCNPPYLTGAEMAALQPEVAREPAMALDGGADGLRFYRHLAAAYRQAMAPGGWMVWEIGWQQAEACKALLEANGWQNVWVKKDFGGNDRAVLAQK